jgi:hypothetical protein
MHTYVSQRRHPLTPQAAAAAAAAAGATATAAVRSAYTYTTSSTVEFGKGMSSSLL